MLREGRLMSELADTNIKFIKEFNGVIVRRCSMANHFANYKPANIDYQL